MVEFALVALLLVMLVFGIIVFGYLLSFKQDVTRAAAEGARVGAVADPPAAVPAAMTADSRYVATFDATNDAVKSFDQECQVDGMDCIVTVHDCGNPAVTDPAAYWNNGVDDCVTVRLEYDYANHPLIVDPPLLSNALPDVVASESVARVNQ